MDLESTDSSDLISYQIVLIDASGGAKPAPGILTLHRNEFVFVGESSAGTEGKTITVPLEALESIRKAGGGLGLGLAKPFLIQLSFRLNSSIPQSTAITLEFGTHRDQRDRILVLMSARRGNPASNEGATPLQPSLQHADGRKSDWMDDDMVEWPAPVKIQIDTAVTAREGHTVFQITCSRAVGSSETWTVHKRYKEFLDLQKDLLELDPRVGSLNFPKKTML
eukprot:SAG31_NODE_267_length_18790_cov_3.661655_5_plen_223_part_00